MGEPQLVGEGLGFLEGPVWIEATEPSTALGAQRGFPDGGGYFAFCSLAKGASVIYRWPAAPQGGPEGNTKPDLTSKPQVLIPSSARCIGLAVESRGVLVGCSVERRGVVRYAFDGKDWEVSTVVDRVEVEPQQGEAKPKERQQAEPQPLNATNDLVVGPSGEIWFTDPAFFTPQDQLKIGYNGVYRIDTKGRTTLMTKDVGVPNGIALSPDASTLYVNDFRAGTIVRMAVRRGGGPGGGGQAQVVLGPAEVVIDLRAECQRRGIKPLGNADGLRVDEAGLLYSTGPGGIWIVDPSRPDGRRGVAHLALAATNLALGPSLEPASGTQGVRAPVGPAARRTMLVTGAGGRVWRVGLK